ncbi:DNA polymerase III subunit beta [Candidatus Woesebacteria bacterium RIFCSPHIGHO2_01_FULL_44_10]|uniref:Beta sliding clamp n=1 Tax=Candidatus Woesebacteria bacterium RIFCSPLOWO2_01_FULL_44_14 TaxID=1802525 RepID=A0A1F8C1Q9_9BACT|nr:MAG: DNA polymerase III subunit beta [Candidatus Woesebacteria bacterium RIFCSPHIGHO2_01_FULL_44_10]OGM53714.1 MAG: DNA polymerase III subunit beta [Candidatus Woesebacteria bacterium RIFCSPHIGHO2_12_FULL_44_11]OGM70060.1 MAG: DNA polymerase III subunit beta [Candidatus Woesebacteria bacterium RIFCSPLOWO2_01_FULL_44_14]
MRLTVLQEDLAKALASASRFVSSRAQLPVLGNIMLSAKKTKLLVAATNLEMAISISVGAKVETEGEIAVPARTVTDIVVNLAPGQTQLVGEKEQLKISQSTFSSSISGMNTNDFPAVSQGLGSDKVALPEEFMGALGKTIFAASTDETRPVLMGALFMLEGKGLSLVATDGFRLSQKKISLSDRQKEKTLKMILPRNTLSEVVKMGEGSLQMQIKPAESQVIFACGKTVLSSRVIEGEYPDFEKIIPKESNTTISVDKVEFVRAIKLASVFARESANVVKFEIGDKTLDVSASSQKSGEQKTSVDAKVEGDGLTISFNYKFIEDFLNSVSGQDVEMKFGDVSSPGVFLDPPDPDYLHLIMPVKIQE